MNIHCPRCATPYAIGPDALLDVDGIVRCMRCGLVFDAVSGEPGDPAQRNRALRLDAHMEQRPQPAAPTDLPFDLPEDLPPLQASDDAGLDINDSLYTQRSRSKPWYTLIAIVLIALLGMQLAWQQRVVLLQHFPALEPLCRYLECRPSLVHKPDAFKVMQRDIRPATTDHDALTFSAVVRNTAQGPQRLPDIQLSLLDNNGSVLIRRRLMPSEYTYPPPPRDHLVAPGEVFTIELDFQDPGSIATGFAIDFL